MAGQKDGGKYKLTLSLEPGFARRLAAYAGFLGEDQSEIATRALKREMRGFSISHRVGPDVEHDGTAEGAVRLARQPDAREAV